MKTLTEKTWIPLGAVVTIGVGALWIANIYFTALATAATVRDIQAERIHERDQYLKHLLQIESDVSEIKGRLGLIDRKPDSEKTR